MRRFRYAAMFFPSFLALGFYFVLFVGALSSNAVERERERERERKNRSLFSGEKKLFKKKYIQHKRFCAG